MGVLINLDLQASWLEAMNSKISGILPIGKTFAPTTSKHNGIEIHVHYIRRCKRLQLGFPTSTTIGITDLPHFEGFLQFCHIIQIAQVSLKVENVYLQ